jgi:ribosomal RNA-processing protein 8
VEGKLVVQRASQTVLRAKAPLILLKSRCQSLSEILGSKFSATLAQRNTLHPKPSTATMFTVPGWNVSASVAPQVEQPKPQDPNKLGKKALKRKRLQEEQVNAENLTEHWDKAVAQAAAKGPEPDKVAQEVDEAAGGDEGDAEKKGKKRKRGPRMNKARREAAANAQEGATADGNNTEGAPKPATADKPAPANAESKRSKKKQKKEQQEQAAVPEMPKLMDPVSLIPEPAGLTPLQKSMRSKLASARFRHLNESLYTKPSADSLSLFKEDPSMFEDYHRGFAQQVEVWPSNPVDDYVASIVARGSINIKDPWKAKKREMKKKGAGGQEIEPESIPFVIPRGDAKPLPRNFKGHCTIADLGCGTASLSYRLQPQIPHLKLALHSFDLSKPSGPSAPLVTVADISALPLQDNSVDVAIFCLALMGTNWLDFIDEAYRILRWRGELWISEIKSRFGRVEKKKNAVPINSIGSLKKSDKKAKGKKKSDKPEVEGIEDSEDEAELAEHVDGAEGKEGTDVGAFVEVLKSRGFVLDALPERPGDAIDLSNKMFVKLQFIKGGQPTKGKNAGTEGTRQGAVGSFKTSSALKMGLKGKKFTAVAEAADDMSEEKEKKVLKPCLYKVR